MLIKLTQLKITNRMIKCAIHFKNRRENIFNGTDEPMEHLILASGSESYRENNFMKKRLNGQNEPEVHWVELIYFALYYIRSSTVQHIREQQSFKL